jgi:hypothetical protein
MGGEIFAVSLCIHASGSAGIAGCLPGPRGGDTGSDLCAAFSRWRQCEIGGRKRRHLDMQIDTIEQWPGELALVIGRTARGAGAGEAGISQMPAAARVHGGDQLHARRIGDVGGGARHLHLAGFQRLAQRIEHAALEFRQFVEEQHAEMREGDFARPRPCPAADQRCHRSAVVRRSERPGALQLAALQLAGDGSHHRDFQRIGRREIGQYAGQRGGDQRFP